MSDVGINMGLFKDTGDTAFDPEKMTRKGFGFEFIQKTEKVAGWGEMCRIGVDDDDDLSV